MQFCVWADAVGRITTVQVTEIHGRVRNVEHGTVPIALQCRAVLHQRLHDLVHAFERVVAERRVAGMAGRPVYANGIEKNAFVRADGSQAGRFADDCMARPRSPRFDECPAAAHAGFFISRTENDQRLLQRAGVEARRCSYGNCQKTLHVGSTQPDIVPIFATQPERVAAPALECRHGIEMSSQHQAAVGVSARWQQGRKQVDLSGSARNVEDFDLERQIFEPCCDAFRGAAVTHVQRRVHAAHGGRGDDCFEHAVEIGDLVRHLLLTFSAAASVAAPPFARKRLDLARSVAETRSMSFRVHNHFLEGVPYQPSPFHDARPPGADPELVVVHNISLPPGQFGGAHVNELFMGRLDPAVHPYFAEIQGLEVSAHLFIRRHGEVIQYVPFDKRAWHAGVSRWQERERCNDFSIGIELEGTDDIPYEFVQYEVLAAVIVALRAAYPAITAGALAGHCDIAPGRKTDPGPSFDWAYLESCLNQQEAEDA